MSEVLSTREIDGMIPETFGPFQALNILGKGGFGIVVRGRHRDTGGFVAIKTVQFDLPIACELIRREVQALERIAHPGVVRVLERGIDQKLPWYAMELLEGTVLRAPITQSQERSDRLSPSEIRSSRMPAWETEQTELLIPRGPSSAIHTMDASSISSMESVDTHVDHEIRLTPIFSLQYVIDLGRTLAEILAFVHGEGVLHLDVKPENIMLRADGAPILFDFGMTLGTLGQVGRENLDHWAAEGGTVVYMAPEQIAKEPVDARTDLYAFGCVLYELLVGRPPFIFESEQAIAYAHVHAKPALPSALLETSIPGELENLVLELLEKEPRRRVGYATDVARRLAALGARSLLPASAPQPKSYLYRPGYVGNRSVLSTLQNRIDKLCSGDSGTLFVGGESGLGKTRTVAEATSRAKLVRTIRSEAVNIHQLGANIRVSGQSPLHIFRPFLRKVVELCQHKTTQHLCDVALAGARVLANYEPEFAQVAGYARVPEPEKMPVAQARERLFSYLFTLSTAMAELSPVLFILDDLHWADELSLSAIEFLAKRLASASSRVLIIGTYRSDEVGPQLATLLQSSSIDVFMLERLDETNVAAVVGEMLALEPPPAALVDFLHARTDGNPYFIAEYLRMAVEQRWVRQSERGGWEVVISATELDDARRADLLPHSLFDLLGHRLSTLSDEARLAVSIAAVLGREVSTPVFREALRCELPSVAAVSLSDELLLRGIIEETATGNLRFVHDKLRETALSQLAHGSGAKLHAIAARAIEAVAGRRRDELAALALHWEAAGERLNARECYLGAARHSMTSYALSEAETFYRSYLRLVENPGTETVRAYNELASHVLFVSARLPEAVDMHRTALMLARSIADKRCEAESLEGLVSTCNRTVGYVSEAESLCQEALSLYKDLGDIAKQSRLRVELAYNFWVYGNLRKVEELLDLNVSLLLASDHKAALAEAFCYLSFTVYLVQCRFAEGEAAALRAFELSADIGHLPLKSLSAHFAAAVYWKRGALESAIEWSERSIALGRTLSNRRRLASYMTWMARARFDAGDLAGALRDAEVAVSSMMSDDDPKSALDLAIWAELLLVSGRIDAARSEYQRALALQYKHQDTRFRWLCLWGLGVLERQAGEIDLAEKLGQEALALAVALGDSAAETASLCEAGHRALYRGEPADIWLTRARSAKPQGLTAMSRWHRFVEALSRSICAAHAKESLFRGELLSQIPLPLREVLGGGDLAPPKKESRQA